MNTIKINGIEWEEILHSQFASLPNSETMCCGFDDGVAENIYFKKKETFPIVFKHPNWKYRGFEVFKDGNIHFISSENEGAVFSDCGNEIELLYKAVEKSKELRK